MKKLNEKTMNKINAGKLIGGAFLDMKDMTGLTVGSVTDEDLYSLTFGIVTDGKH